MKRLLITGAAGGLGRLARERLAGMADTLRLSDVADLGAAAAHEECVPCDLGDAAAVMDLVEGCDGIVHFGGVSTEQPFEPILNANIRGVYNLYEAARAHGRPRILFASSNHTIGFHPVTERLDAACEYRPDGLYGLSKVYGEQLAMLYYHKFGIETARVRIGSCFPEPRDHRMLATWLSPDDLVAMVQAVFRVPVLGCPVIWGASANDTAWWDNSAAGYVGWVPQDNSEGFRGKLDATVAKPGPEDPIARWQGGGFALEPIKT